jgi:hypothetical protein
MRESQSIFGWLEQPLTKANNRVAKKPGRRNLGKRSQLFMREA